MAFDVVSYALSMGYTSSSLTGAGALKGEKGENGKSAYEIALDNGFVGTEAEWLESLKADSTTVETIVEEKVQEQIETQLDNTIQEKVDQAIEDALGGESGDNSTSNADDEINSWFE